MPTLRARRLDAPRGRAALLVALPVSVRVRTLRVTLRIRIKVKVMPPCTSLVALSVILIELSQTQTAASNPN